ncbi:MAG: multiheme c-type cytochrome, partial [bacterium]|nr:hypothetical protein [Planctomycetota bacterium]
MVTLFDTKLHDEIEETVVLIPKAPTTSVLFVLLASIFLLAGASANHIRFHHPVYSQDPPPAPSAENDDLLEDDLLGDDLLDDLLETVKPSENSPDRQTVVDHSREEHEKIFANNDFPSANKCAKCHPKQYREWSVSQHAYSQLSPLMVSLQLALNKGTSSTTGDYCVRC